MNQDPVPFVARFDVPRDPFGDGAPPEFAVGLGRPYRLAIHIVNASAVVERYRAEVVGPGPGAVQQETIGPGLFPGEAGVAAVDLTLPRTKPPGRHLLGVKVWAESNPSQALLLQFYATVQATVHCTLRVEPPSVTTSKRAHFDVIVQNDGANAAADLALEAADAGGTVKTRFASRRLRVEPGTFASTRLTAAGGRPIHGAPVSRILTITADADGERLQADVTIIQKPIIPRYAFPLMLVLLLLLLWARLLIPLVNHLGGGSSASSNLALAAGTAGTQAALAGNGPPANAISGNVTIQSTRQGLGGATVGAFLLSPPEQSSPGSTIPGGFISTPVAQAVTDANGNYRISGLRANTYHLKFSAPGFPDEWYDNVTTFAAGKDVPVVNGKTSTANISVAGLPGTIHGTVSVPLGNGITNAAGVTVELIPTSAASLPAVGAPGPASNALPAAGDTTATTAATTAAGTGSDPMPIAFVTDVTPPPPAPVGPKYSVTDVSGAYTFTGLPTPGTVELLFNRPGFAQQAINVTLTAGQTATAPPVAMSSTATLSSISGVVTDGATGAGLGGVTVLATNGTVSTTVTTATTGNNVGSYLISGLAPSNYTLTFSLDGYGSASLAVPNLLAGQTLAGQNATLTTATGTLLGTVLVPAPGGGSVGLPGAQVTATDGTTTRTVASNTSPPGQYEMTDMPAGVFTITASATGYAVEARVVTITPGQPNQVDLPLTPGVSAIAGTVLAAPASGPPYPIAGTVTVTVSGSAQTTVTAGADGSYAIPNLAPGAYTLTFASQGFAAATVHVTVAANQTFSQDVSLQPLPGSIGGTVAGPTLAAPSGEPLAGVTVSLAGLGTFSATTGSDGSWSVPNVPTGGNYTISFAATGYVTATQTVTVPAGGSVSLGLTNLTTAPGAITGQVVTSTGAVSGVAITLTPLVNNAPSTTGVQTETSTASAPFSFNNLPTPATYQLTFNSPLLAQPPLTLDVALDAGQLRALGPITVSYLSGQVSGTLEGPVTSLAVQGIAGVNLMLTGGPSSLTTTTDASGNFSFTAVPTGIQLSLVVNPTGYVTPPQTQFTLSPAQSYSLGVIVLTPSPGQVTAVVDNGPGVPLTDAVANLQSVVSTGGGSTPVTGLQACAATTYPDGGWIPVPVTGPLVFAGPAPPVVTPETYTLTIQQCPDPALPHTPAPYSTQLFVGPGQTVNLGTLDLATLVPGEIQGVVTDQNGLPVNLASVTVTPSSPGGAPVGSAVSNANGVFTVNGVANGTYQVSVSAFGYSSASQAIVVTAGAVNSMALTLQANSLTLTGTATWDRYTTASPGPCAPGGTAFGGITVSAASSLGTSTGTVDSTGQGFTVNGLFPGIKYVITVSTPSYTLNAGTTSQQTIASISSTKTITLAPGQNLDIGLFANLVPSNCSSS